MFTLPIYWTKVYKTKPSKTHLAGMNWYRNAFHIDQNNLKQDFQQLLDTQYGLMESFTIDQPYTVSYSIYYKNPSCDGSNIIALSEKIFLDFLQKASIVSEDNVKHHLGSTWTIAGQDKLNPRVEITIIPQEP